MPNIVNVNSTQYWMFNQNADSFNSPNALAQWNNRFTANFGGVSTQQNLQSVTAVGNTTNLGIAFNDTQVSPKGVTLIAPTAVTNSYSLKLPAAQATASGQALTNDGAGNLSWTQSNNTTLYALTPYKTSGGGAGFTYIDVVSLLNTPLATAQSFFPIGSLLTITRFFGTATRPVLTVTGAITSPSANNYRIPISGLGSFDIFTGDGVIVIRTNSFIEFDSPLVWQSSNSKIGLEFDNTLSTSTTSGVLQINQQGATNGQALVWNGTTWAPSSVGGASNLTSVLTAGNTANNLNLILTGTGLLQTTAGLQLNGSTSGSITHKSSASVASAYTLTWPSALPSASGQVLSSDTSGALSWISTAAASSTLTQVLTAGNTANNLNLVLTGTGNLQTTAGLQLNGASTGSVTFKSAATVVTPYTLIFPTSLPSTAGQVLTSDTNGTLTWASGGSGSVGTLQQVLTNGNSATSVPSAITLFSDATQPFTFGINANTVRLGNANTAIFFDPTSTGNLRLGINSSSVNVTANGTLTCSSATFLSGTTSLSIVPTSNLVSYAATAGQDTSLSFTSAGAGAITWGNIGSFTGLQMVGGNAVSTILNAVGSGAGALGLQLNSRLSGSAVQLGFMGAANYVLRKVLQLVETVTISSSGTDTNVPLLISVQGTSNLSLVMHCILD